MDVSDISKDIFTQRKKIFFVGAMGNGKTEISINYSLYWSKFLNKQITLIDLDMVKPYFRLRQIALDIDTDHSVEIVYPEGKYGYVDFPMISPRLESAIVDPNHHAVIDVGGDDTGARLVGRYRSRLSTENVEFWYVHNGLRPFSRGFTDIMEMVQNIERVSHFKITGIVHNSHMMSESKISHLISHIEEVEKLSKMMEVPIIFHCIREELYKEASKKLKDVPLLPLKLYLTPKWLK